MEVTSKEIISLRKEEQTIFLDEGALETILNQPAIRDKYICVVSVAGEYRGGKSFLLNFLIRYLRSIKDVGQFNARDWMDPDLEPLKGFSFASGRKRCTTGIHLWPEVFCTSLPSGEEIAILLVDTQGSFDNQSTVDDCAKIFALSTLISTTQVYNLSRNIKQYDLDHLRCFTSYGGLLSDAKKSKFQNLVFLVRDWPYDYEKPYGVAGGATLLDEVFSSTNKEVRGHLDSITNSFDDISCFLMPYPGRAVESSNFNGNLSEIDENFKIHVRDFVTMILASDNLAVKTINGARITAGQLAVYLKEYCNILQGADVPDVQAVSQANIEAHHKIAATESFEVYKTRMTKEAGTRCYSSSEFYNLHHRCEYEAVQNYKSARKVFDLEVYEKYFCNLTKSIKKEFRKYKKINDDKLEADEERKKKSKEQIKLATEGPSTSTATGMSPETIGTIVAGVGALAMAAFFGYKAFSGSKNNNK